MRILWSAIDEALIVVGSRNSAVNTMWRMIPEQERTPARRKLTIALVDWMREHVELHGPTRPTVADIEPVVTGGQP